MEIWEKKLKEHFGSAVVDKKKAMENQVQSLPRYVSEYLLGFFCEEEITSDSTREMNNYIKEHRIEGREKEVAKHRLRENLNMKIIDKFKVKINLKKNQPDNRMEVPSLGINDAEVYRNVLNEHPRLLIDGLWGMGELEYHNEEGKVYLNKFKPFQLSDIDTEEFIESRNEFSTDEWMNIIISSMGLNFLNYTRRQKIVLISRLIPMVENNVFMMEFGRPGTGKTYAYENISSYSRVISGSQISPAQLFYNLQTKQDGLLVQYDVLLFDEIDKVKDKGLDEIVVNKLYSYLESGKFDRGGVEKASDCGLIMVGNLTPGPLDIDCLLDNLLHDKLKHSAFLDRLTAVIPGWELESIKDPEISITKNFGFAADYFSEILHKVRRENYPYITKRIKYINGSIRDTKSIERVLNGLIKIIYPNGKINNDELKELCDYAVELRNYVNHQNFKINGDEKFKKEIHYEIKEEKI
jgi:ATP-dependent Lon protease